jgi:hypothetical protein
MAKNHVKVSQVVNEFLVTQDHDDYAGHVNETSVRVQALRGVREMGFDILQAVRSLKITVDQTTDSVELPCDYVDWTKIGVVGNDGLVYVLGQNKNINYSQKMKECGECEDREDSKSSTSGFSSSSGDGIESGFNSNVFRNLVYQNNEGRLYGLGGGSYYGQFRINLDQNRIELSLDSGISEIVLEYIADEARAEDPSVHIYAEQALRSYIYYRIVERKASVPANEKARARQEYYNELRKANARMKSFTKEELLKTIRKNSKQSPKL